MIPAETALRGANHPSGPCIMQQSCYLNTNLVLSYNLELVRKEIGHYCSVSFFVLNRLSVSFLCRYATIALRNERSSSSSSVK